MAIISDRVARYRLWFRRATKTASFRFLSGILALATPLLAGTPALGVPIGGAASSGRHTRPTSRCDAAVPTDAELQTRGATIGRVDIDVNDIFNTADPGQDNFAFRTVNRLHISTRDHVVRQQLLFSPGDPYSAELLDESERLLRADSYIYDARICPVDFHDGVVDVVVHTRDVWTLDGGFRFGRAGGANRTGVQLQDRNFLGLGKDIKLLWTSDVDRTSQLARYQDDDLFGSRWQLRGIFADNSDGQIHQLDLQRPFFSLDSRWAFGVSGYSVEEVDKLYDRGLITDRFQRRQERFELYGGLSPGLRGGMTHRWTAGFTYSRDRFAPAPDAPPPTVGLTDRVLAYPWIGFNLVQNGFIKEEDLNLIGRTEDLNLGRRLSLRLGWSSPAVGADRSRLVYDAAAHWGWQPRANRILRASLDANGRWSRGHAEDLLTSVRGEAYQRDFGGQLFYAGLQLDLAHRLDPDRQLLLGGDTGLRGYPLRYQQGNRRVLLTLEQRFFSPRDYFHLFHLGAAVFFDAGAAWFDRQQELDDRLLRDVGVGLRIGSSRSARGALVHLDLALPLDHPGSIKRIQWLVSTEQTF
jgi:hypothetical protein